MTTSETSNWWYAYKVAVSIGACIGATYGMGKYRRPKSNRVLECVDFVRDTFIGGAIGALYVATFPLSTLVAEACDTVPSKSATVPPTACPPKQDESLPGVDGMESEL